MEFKFRAVDNTPPPAPTPTSFPNTVAYISHSSLRGGFPGMIPSSRNSSFRMPMSNGNEALWRELEKEQIRREIITGEIERRRELEEEVRRELAAERRWGMTMAATSHGFSFDERVSAMRLTPSPYLFDNNAQPQPQPQTQLPQLVPPAEFKPSPETNNDKVIKLGPVQIPPPSLYQLHSNAWPHPQLPQLVAPAEEFKPSPETNSDKVVKLGSNYFLSPFRYQFDNNAWPQPQLEQLMAPVEELKSSQETNSDKVVNLSSVKFPSPGRYRFDAWPLPKLPELLAPDEIKPSPETDKDKVIKLAKPDPDHFDAKRKAVTPPDADGSDHIPTGLKKKSKEEWICEVCQVSATSEKGLNDHLQGRKHKTKEIGLRKKKFVKSTKTSSKKSEKSVKPMETATSGLDAKAFRPPVQSSITWGGINQIMADKGSAKSNNEEQSVQKIVKSNEPKDTATSGLDAKADRSPPLQPSITWGDINQKMAGKGAVESITEEQLVQKFFKSNESGDTVTSGLDAKADRLPFESTFLTWGDINKTTANKGLAKYNEEQLVQKNVKSSEPIDPAALGLDVKTDTPSLQPNFIPRGDITKTTAKKIAVGSKYEEQSIKNENGTENVQGGMNALKRKRMKFWCEICEVGALSHVVMESHKKGKKHLARLKTSSVSVEASGLIKDTGAGNKEAMITVANNFADSD
ncbi:hypothetical protein TanjilG_09503 [Lupinus angustifolius]|uniref:U1-type domain-containing protein n=1 Tax=Lupinus angustifolius TaxID=3871 RepID=A0A4P1RVZ4_LUPAN|nr:PREDICTED: uncharacterized protein LOC109346493 [Lupinus angustifolius]OIW19483.1 hypothetical protein TanjilG_09503 [Lupinus angustifolius]